MSLLNYFPSVDGDYPNAKLPNACSPLCKVLSSSLIAAVNAEVNRVQKSSGRGNYNKFTPEQKAVIGRRPAKYGVLSSICYYSTKFPEPLKESSMHRWKNAYTAELCKRQKDGNDE